jgi:hypothetical protein
MGSDAAWCSAASPDATPRNGIREDRIVSDKNSISLAVWDVPMPVVAGEKISIKVGAKSASGRKLGGCRVEVSDATGAVVASGQLGEAPLAGTEALYWTALDVPAPAQHQAAEYSVRLVPDDAIATRFSVAAAAKPEHRLSVTVTERDTAEALGDVEIRLGPFHARTDKTGHAELRLCKGDYQLQLWRTAHIAAPQPLSVTGDLSLELKMVHVPEEHPDARWVR